MNSPDNILILIDWPITPPWLKYLNLSELSQDFRIHFVEIAITPGQRKAFSNRSDQQNEITGSRRTVTDAWDLLGISRQFRSVIMVDMTVAGLASYLLLNVASRRKEIVVIKFMIGIIPPPPRKAGLFRRALEIVTECGFYPAIRRMASRISQRTVKRLLRHDYSVLGGLSALKMLSKHPGKLVPSVSFDFLEYQTRRAPAPQVSQDYAILIEDNMFHDTDFMLVGLEDSTGAPAYFANLSKYLGKVQDLTGTPVKVLPHPKSDRARLRSYLPEFDQIEGPSAEAISGARFVLMHSSTALSFALLAGKPILFMECEGLRQSLREGMETMAAAIGLRSYRIGDLDELFSAGMGRLVPSEDKRMSYIGEYIRHPDAKLFSFGEIVRFVRDEARSCSDVECTTMS